MGEKRDDVFARESARSAGCDKPRENSIGARAQRFARRIFNSEAKAAKFSGDAARQRAVGRHKRGGLARLFQDSRMPMASAKASSRSSAASMKATSARAVSRSVAGTLAR